VSGDLIQFGSHDEVVLVEPFDLLGLERHGRVPPPEANVGVVTLPFGQVACLLHKPERLGEVLEPEGSFDPAGFIEDRPLGGLMAVRFNLIMTERQDPAATRRTAFADEGYRL
jgi:hypothetical protein